MTWNRDATGPIVLVCEHASAFIPERYAVLGLSEAAAISHAAWDPGAVALARQLSISLNAPLVTSGVSRLVHDCNRPPGHASAMPTRVEAFDVPGNASLSQADVDERVQNVYTPFETALRSVLDARARLTLPTVVVTIHSFTPCWLDKVRTVELGILHEADTRLADAMLELAGDHVTLNTRRNEPYSPADGVTWTLQKHALPRSLPNVMIEVRNDLVRDDQAVEAVAMQLDSLLKHAVQRVVPCRAYTGVD